MNDFAHGLSGLYCYDQTITEAVSVRRRKRQPSSVIAK
jgi:hypothetical protein